MDAKQYQEIFRKHIGIAKSIFSGLPNQREAIEWASDAVNEAIATHKPELGCLSTHVTYIAKKYRTDFIRSSRRWKGIHQNGQPVGNLCQAGYKRIATYTPKYTDDEWRPRSTIRIRKEVAIAREYDWDFILDLKDIIEETRKGHYMDGKMSIAVEDWLNEVSDEITKLKLGCTRFYVQRCQRKFRKLVRKKLTLE